MNENEWKDREELLEVTYNLYMLVGQAAPDAFKNGVTDDFGTCDEGDYYAGKIIEAARNILREHGIIGVG